MAPLQEMKGEDFMSGIYSKLMGQINLVLAGQHTINAGGSFTLISGILAEDPIQNGVSLSVVNGAINSFVIAAANELKNDVRINAVSPGLVEDSYEAMGKYFPGHNPVPMNRVVNAFVKSVEGVRTGEIIKVY
jgi:NAD(P)-dependent dehydrogenase (short-subunit alcohol dehydrogenase family)